jgi:hypothetical protein
MAFSLMFLVLLVQRIALEWWPKCGLVEVFTLPQLNLDLPAPLTFASAEGEGRKPPCEFSGRKAQTPQAEIESFALKLWTV